MEEFVGYVTGNEGTSPYEFSVRIKNESGRTPKRMLRIGDIVKTSFEYENFGRVTIYGVVTEINSRWDEEYIPGFEEILMIEKKVKPTMKTFTARVVTTRIISEKDRFHVPDVPPVPGSEVYLVGRENIDEALGFDEIKRKGKALPVGVLDNGEVCYLDLDYILGKNGAHINISGQSGVASKTSYMTFLMRSIIDTIKDQKPIFIIFNVKGQSLMNIDKFSRSWMIAQKEEIGKYWKSLYEKMGVKAEPFDNVEFYAVMKSTVNRRANSIRPTAKVFWWSTEDFFEYDLFEMIFDPEELSRNSNLMLGVILIEEYVEEAKKRKKMTKGKGSSEWRLPKDPRDLVEMIENENSHLHKFLIEKGLQKTTLKLLQRRLQLAIRSGLDLVWSYGSEEEKKRAKINWNRQGGITVVDISKLRTRIQYIVVGGILREVMRWKETSGTISTSPVFIMIDELNKYSPRSEKSEIASIFRDVAERGRSFGIILVGAEQTASEVDYRVVTQSSTTVVGRQKWVELGSAEYGHLLPEQKRKAATLRQGEVIVDQPFLRVPLAVRFPFPAWALNEDDVHIEEDESYEDILM